MSVHAKAEALAALGAHVFPVHPVTSAPLTKSGFKDASSDVPTVREMFRGLDAKVGVATGASGLVVLDVDRKNGKDGFQSLEDAWLKITPTLSYSTPRGGTHYIYRSVDGHLPPSNNYRGLEGVDRKSGGSYIVYHGEVIGFPSLIAEAPQWLLDRTPERLQNRYDGGVDEWFGRLTEGAPNTRVQAAIDRVPDDMMHADMVERQYNAVRYGAEGEPGVPVLLDVLRKKWLSRPPENHTTPRDQWESKFEEALESAVEKYGEFTGEFDSLVKFDLGSLPEGVNLDLLVGPVEADGPGIRSAIANMKHFGVSPETIVSTVWGAPKTQKMAREWGVSYITQLVEQTPATQSHPRENPSLKLGPTELVETALLTNEEEHFVSKRPGFVENYIRLASEGGRINETYFRSAAWSILSMVFAFRGYIPVSGTDQMGLNLWNVTLGESTTGKSRARMFRDEMLSRLFGGQGEVGYSLGTNSSPQGMHLSLIQRDGLPSILDADEASGVFAQMGKVEWMTGLSDMLAHWYEGKVDSSSKVSLKEFRGKSARTSFHVHMFATPDRFFDTVTRDMFLSGFLARFTWSIGPEPADTDDRFQFDQEENPTPKGSDSVELRELMVDVTAATRKFTKPTPILATSDALSRMSSAYKKMYRTLENGENWDILKPSITRLADTIRKCATLSAMYRGSDFVELYDALYAINATQEWYDNLRTVASRVVQGEFQRDVENIEAYVSRMNRVSRAKLLHHFRNVIAKSPRELDDRINYLIDSGRMIRVEEGRSISYEVNQ